MGKRAALFSVLALVVSLSWGQDARETSKSTAVFGMDAFMGAPSLFNGVFDAPFPGISLRFRATPTLEFSLDYAFMNIEYYYPEEASGAWFGPVPWSSMPELFAAYRDSWLFYQTKHFLAPFVWYRSILSETPVHLTLRLGLGPAFSLIIPNEASQYYPGFLDEFTAFSQSFSINLGAASRIGLETALWDNFVFGADLLFIVDSFVNVASDIAHYGYGYIERAGNLLLFIGVRI